MFETETVMTLLEFEMDLEVEVRTLCLHRDGGKTSGIEL
jgi:hypothetical protein